MGKAISEIVSQYQLVHIPVPLIERQSLSAGEPFGIQPLESHWIGAASADSQLSSCWTAPDRVNIPMVGVGSYLT